MRPQLSGFGALTIAALVLALGSPAALNAQRSRGAGGGGDDGGRSAGGDRGVAVPRGGDAGPRGGDAGPRGGGDAGPRGGGDAGPRGGDAGSRGGDEGGRTSAGGASGGGSSPRTTAETQDTSGDRAVPRRPREDRNTVGRAVPRADAPPFRGGTVVVNSGGYYGGYYPWGYGGLGLGGYYGFYDPWYDPFYYGSGSYGSGYYGSYYGRSYNSGYEGQLRLKVKPSDADVFVDGYYAGIVDEFDNVFQHLNIETGPHRIEVREDGYEPLTFEVRILPGRTVTYKGELKRNP